jgi:hypothetical protein
MRRLPTRGATVALFCALVGSLSAGRSPATPLALTGQRQSPRSTGTLQGTVRWNGAEVPQPTAVQNATDPDVCGRMHTLEDLLVSEHGGGVNNVIVALVDLPAGTVPPPAPGQLLLDNIDCRFSPHVTVLTVGSLFETRNSDPTLHTVHLYGPSEANIALPLQSMTVSRTLENAGMFIVKCDVHGWMQAFIRVDDHPFHAVTDESGSFRITDVPAGEYTLEAWHETLGTQHRTVQVRDGAITTIAFEFSGRGQ